MTLMQSPFMLHFNSDECHNHHLNDNRFFSFLSRVFCGIKESELRETQEYAFR